MDTDYIFFFTHTSAQCIIHYISYKRKDGFF